MTKEKLIAKSRELAEGGDDLKVLHNKVHYIIRRHSTSLYLVFRKDWRLLKQDTLEGCIAYITREEPGYVTKLNK